MIQPRPAAASYLWAEPHTPDADALEADAAKHWDCFYTVNENRFYKDRRYLGREWPALLRGPATVLEVGCGVGNTAYPLLAANPQLRVLACDFSSTAVDVFRAHPQYSTGRVHAFVADLAQPGSLCSPHDHPVAPSSVDYVTLVFVLSALPPHKHATAVANVASALKPGGRVLLRDYAAGDAAQERREAAGGRHLGPRYYVRGDSTLCVHFSPSELRSLFAAAGFTCVALDVHERAVNNRKEGTTYNRKWVQAEFQLPDCTTAAGSVSGDARVPPAPSGLDPAAHTGARRKHRRGRRRSQRTAAHPPDGADGSPGGEEQDPARPQPSPPPPCGVACGASSGACRQGQHRSNKQAESTVRGQTVDQCRPRVMLDYADPTSDSLDNGDDCGLAPHVPHPALPTEQPHVASGLALPASTPAAAGLLVGTWLTGAAGRLAAHATDLPGQASGRAQLPETLDTADELVSALSPAGQATWGRAAGRRAAVPRSPPGLSALRGSSGRVGPGRGSADTPAGTLRSKPGGRDDEPAGDARHSAGRGGAAARIEWELEREFFDVIQRNTQEVVAEEIAECVAPPIVLADPFASLRPKPTSTAPPRATSALPQCTAGTPQLVTVPLDDSTPHQPQSPQAPWPCQSPEHALHLSQMPVQPGLTFALPTSAYRCPEQQGGVVVAQGRAAAAELALAGLLREALQGWQQGVSSSAAQLTAMLRRPGGTVLQLGTGPGAVAGMTLVRCSGARRVLLTHPNRATLHDVAACVHANAPSLVVERLRLAQLVLGDPQNTDNIMTQLSKGSRAAGGTGLVIVCGDVGTAAGLPGIGRGGDVQRALCGLLSLCRTAAERVAGAGGQHASGVPAVFVALTPPELAGQLEHAALGVGWAVSDACSRHLTNQVAARSMGLHVVVLTAVPTG